MSDRPIRMAVAGIGWPPETFLQRMLLGLRASGMEITVVGPVDPARSGEPGLKWVCAPAWEGAPARRVLALIRQWAGALRRDPRQTRRFVTEAAAGGRLDCQRLNRLLPFVGRRWDLIYFPWNTAAIACLPVFDLKIPVIISCRGAHVNVAPHNPDRADIKAGLRETFDRATYVHCVSDDILRNGRLMGLDPAKARVIRPAVDPEDFSPRDAAPGSEEMFQIVTTGSLIWRKGTEYALMAFQKLVAAGVDARFHLIGDGPERQRVTYTVEDMGLSGRVILHGKLPAPQVKALLRKMDAFVLSSLSEGISNAVLEAMACGLPVVSTECGGMREAIEDGKDGYLVATRDPGAMTERLLILARDASLRAQIGRAARQRVIRQFSIADQVSQWRGLIEQAAALEPRVPAR